MVVFWFFGFCNWKFVYFCSRKLVDGRNMVAGSRLLPPYIEGSTPSANSSTHWSMTATGSFTPYEVG